MHVASLKGSSPGPTENVVYALEVIGAVEGSFAERIFHVSSLLEELKETESFQEA